MKQLSIALLVLAASGAAVASPSAVGPFGAPATSPGPALSSCPSTALPAPTVADYRRAFVPADAKMVMHFDLKNLRASQLGKALSSHRNEIEIDDLDELIETLGFDPLKELDSVTAYSTSHDEENFGAILVATSAIDTALEKLPEQEGYRAVSKGGIDFFQFDDLVGSWHIMESGERLVMLGKTLDIALRGHQVIHGDIPSQASDRARLPQPSRGAILFLAGGGEMLKQHGHHGGMGSSFMEMVEGAQFEMGESEGHLRMHLAVSTDSSEEARDLKEMLGGFMALGRILIANEADVPDELAGLMRAIDVRMEGKQLSIRLSVPIKQAMGFMQDHVR